MAAFPLSILALAAGVYLLIKVKREYLSGLFSVLAWLIIAASVVSIGVSGVRAVHGLRGGKCHDKENCRVEKEIVIKDGKAGRCHRMVGGSGCSMEGCEMKGCRMEGDSCIMEKAVCEKIMGKEACDAMEKERGRCIMSKEECMKMCHGDKKTGGCGMHHGEGMGEENPGCCQKKI